MTITPLDTCGLVHLRGAKYAAVRDCHDPLIEALLENYSFWRRKGAEAGKTLAPATASSTLFDTVAVYLAMEQKLCRMERLKLKVTDDGKTVVDPDGKAMDVATAWKDLGRFEDLLVRRLTSGAGR